MIYISIMKHTHLKSSCTNMKLVVQIIFQRAVKVTHDRRDSIRGHLRAPWNYRSNTAYHRLTEKERLR